MIRGIIMARRGVGLLAAGALVALLGADEGDCTGSPTINNTVIVCVSADGSGKCENQAVSDWRSSLLQDPRVDSPTADWVNDADDKAAEEIALWLNVPDTAAQWTTYVPAAPNGSEPEPTSTFLDDADRAMTQAVEAVREPVRSLAVSTGAVVTSDGGSFPLLIIKTSGPMLSQILASSPAISKVEKLRDMGVMPTSVGGGLLPTEDMNRLIGSDTWRLPQLEGASAGVAVIDQGILPSHNAFSRFFRADGGSARAFDCTNGGCIEGGSQFFPVQCTDGGCHGMGVASVIASNSWRTGYRGISRASIFSYNIYKLGGVFGVTAPPSAIVNALIRAVTDRVSLVNMSFALSGTTVDPTVSRLLDLLHDRGIGVFIAVGNGAKYSPNACPNGNSTRTDSLEQSVNRLSDSGKVFGVGAFDYNDNVSACYSSFGSSTRKGVMPDIMGHAPTNKPAQNTDQDYSAVAAIPAAGTDSDSSIYANKNLAGFSGTSAATPVVVGVAALLREHMRSGGNRIVRPGELFATLLNYGQNTRIAKLRSQTGKVGPIKLPARTRTELSFGTRAFSSQDAEFIVPFNVRPGATRARITLWWPVGRENVDNDVRRDAIRPLDVELRVTRQDGSNACEPQRNTGNSLKCDVSVGVAPGLWAARLRHVGDAAVRPLYRNVSWSLSLER